MTANQVALAALNRLAGKLPGARKGPSARRRAVTALEAQLQLFQIRTLLQDLKGQVWRKFSRERGEAKSKFFTCLLMIISSWSGMSGGRYRVVDVHSEN
jgi:hypothetical protein